MKKVFVLMSLVVSLAVSAKVTIQATVNGCTLGKSSKSEVLKKMSKMHANIIAQNDTVIFFSSEKFFAEDINFRYCNVGFTEDTVSSIFLFDNIDKVTISQIEDVKAKYDSLKVLRGNDVLDSYRHVLGDFKVDSNRVRAYGDGINTIIILEGDSSRGLIYEAVNYVLQVHGRKLSKMFEDLYSSLFPDYDNANAVKSVAGCVFGDSRQNVTNKFHLKTNKYIKSDAHSVLYSGITIGGNYFKRGTLYFINDKFVSCKFESEFYTWKYEEAKATYDALCSQYDRKYTNAHHFDQSEDDLCSAYGMFQDDYEEGQMYPIIISLRKNVSQGGDTYYYVSVSYFEGRLKTMYNDEI
ncbi:MAG: hypothetical protein MJZ75_05585 [Paludibacteraceae bacterium]|nr:hypothetical protein [Paludibacteraceae bacterium]